MGQIDSLHRRVIHLLIAKGGSSGQSVENSVPMTMHFVKQMSSNLNVYKREKQNR